VRSFERDHEQEQQGVEEARRGLAGAPEAAVERLASSVGNQAFGVLARDGAGIMADGTAHPDVAAAIARRHGGGAPLDEGVRTKYESALGDSFGDVRVHTGPEADALARSVSARAFTTGTDVYFAQGEYRPSSSDGGRLLGHELAHVVQQRGAPTTGPLRVSQPGEPLEQDADAASRGLA
jgi:hypothetical protein